MNCKLNHLTNRWSFVEALPKTEVGNRILRFLSCCYSTHSFENMATGGLDFGSNSEEEKFSCPVCLEIFESPVSIPCGHT